MGLFRRREPLHVRLAREGDVPFGDDAPRRPWDIAGIHGLHRARRWDAVVTLEAGDLKADRAEFVVLPDGRAVVLEGPPDVTALTAPLEGALRPPYRAEGVRRDDGLWAVGARTIEVVELPGVAGDELELVSHGAERTLVVDGARSFGTIPVLERPEHVVRGRRLDGELWEIEVHPL